MSWDVVQRIAIAISFCQNNLHHPSTSDVTLGDDHYQRSSSKKIYIAITVQSMILIRVRVKLIQLLLQPHPACLIVKLASKFKSQ